MIHTKRHFTVAPAPDARELADKLVNQSWCGCNGFEHGGYLFLNDAFSADGAQEYAVLKPVEDGAYAQVESITFSWCTVDEAHSYIEQTARGEDDEHAGAPFALTVETPDEHDTCALCA